MYSKSTGGESAELASADPSTGSGRAGAGRIAHSLNDGDEVYLDPDLAMALAVVEIPTARLELIRMRQGAVHKAMVFDIAPIGAVAVYPDSDHLLLSSTISVEELAEGLVRVLCAGKEPVRGPAIEGVSYELLFVSLLPAEPFGAATVATSLGALGAQIDVAQTQATLDALVTSGWLLKDASQFRWSSTGQEKRRALVPEETIDVVGTLFFDTGGDRRVFRFSRCGEQLWKAEPFLAGHDQPPAEDASLFTTWSTFLGVTLVPQSRQMVEKFAQELLGLPRPAPAAAKGVQLRKR